MCTIELYVLQVVHTAKRYRLSSKRIAHGDPPPLPLSPFSAPHVAQLLSYHGDHFIKFIHLFHTNC